jgi:hypothetical protein
MGYVFNNNQPFVFNYNNGFCGTEQREYCTLKESNDRISVQFKIAPNTTNLIKDSSMTAGSNISASLDNPGTGWTASNFTFSNDQGGYKSNGAVTGSLTQTLTGAAIGNIYYVRFKVTTINTGTLTFAIGGVTSPTNFGASAGSFWYTGCFLATSTAGITITSNTTWTGYVEECEVYIVDALTGSGLDFDSTSGTEYVDTWSFSTNVCHVQGNTNSLFPQLSNNSFSLTLGVTYKIVLTITNITEGDISVYFGGALIGVISANGVYTFSGTTTTGFLGTALSLAPSANFNGCVDNVYLYSYDSYLNAAIFDLNDNWVMDIPSTYVAQSGEWVYIEFTGTQIGLDEGCYRICLTENASSDPVQEEVFNGDFVAKDEGWTYNNPAGSTEWTFPDDYCVGKDYSTLDILQIGQKLTGKSCWIGSELTCTFDINVLSANGQFTFVAYGFNTTTIYNTTVYTGGQTGSKSVTFTVTDDTEVVIRFDFTALSIEEPGAYEEVQFTNVSVMDLGCDLTYPYCSNCFNLKASHECSKELEWYNTKNSFGFNYANSTVNPTFNLRLLCEFGKWMHKQNWNVWKNYNLGNQIAYADTKEVTEVRTEMLPENIHRAIAVARQHEYFYIESVRSYATEEDYEPEWTDKNKNFAIARFEIWQEALRSNACGIDVTSATDQQYLIDPQDESCVISLE